MDGMLTLREVMDYLDRDQVEIEKLVKKGRLSAFKIGGTYLRFKKDQIIEIKRGLLKKSGQSTPYLAKARDYWYFNRFYILSAILLVLVLYLLVQ